MKIMLVTFGLLTLSLGTVCQADFLLVDLFNDEDLSTSTQTNGGFYEVDNGEQKNGVSYEADNVAHIVNGQSQNISGILSNNKVTVSPILRTTWTIKEYDLPANSKYIANSWQTSSDFTDAPELELVTDFELNTVTFATDKTNVIDSLALNMDLSDVSGFTLIATFTETGYDLRGVGLSVEGEVETVVISGNWFDTPFDYSDLQGEDIHVGTFVNGQVNAAFGFSIAEVTVENIPEPAVAGLISIFGVGMITYRRIFGRHEDDGV